MTELKAIVLDNLNKMERETRQKQLALENQITALEAKLMKLEEKLLDLSKQYSDLEPLIKGLSNIVENN